MVVLSRLFGVEQSQSPGGEDDDVLGAAQAIIRTGRPWLGLLDGADLLSATAVIRLRHYLGGIYRLVQDARSADARLAFVVASRRDDGWRGVTPYPRLSVLPLGGLGPSAVQDALDGLALRMPVVHSVAELRQDAEVVQRVTEGVPDLVQQSLRWIQEEEWLAIGRLDNPQLFEKIVAPYIRNRLLAPDSLLPKAEDQPEKAMQRLDVLLSALRALVPYRFFTLYHIRHHMDEDVSFEDALKDADWSVEDLWQAISDMALLYRPLDEAWQEIHPAVRRLLYRYFYSPQERAAAHLRVRDFTMTWADQLVGKEQVIVMVEAIWHEAVRLRSSSAAALGGDLVRFARMQSLAVRPSFNSLPELRNLRLSACRMTMNFSARSPASRDYSTLLSEFSLCLMCRRPDMTNSEPFPQYIPRTEEQRRIIAEAARVRAAGRSRAVLLYGRGGTGKSRLVQQLPEIDQDRSVIWLDPIGVDDSQHWLLSNLERYVAAQLDPDVRYFSRYLEYVSELPRQRPTPISRETVLSHLNRIKAVFTECYEGYIDGTGNTVVITLDTVEAIRSMHFLSTVTQWMKALSGTLFILAGRPPSGAADQPDTISTALKAPPLDMPVTTIPLGEFNAADCREYLTPISKEAGLSGEEVEKLVHLTQGHPLWLALTVGYLTSEGLPEELRAPLEQIKEELPYHGAPTAAGRDRAESFKGHLVAPYQRTDFWHETMKRLAVVRESVSQPIWLQLMADRPLPADAADPDRAWQELRATEWIRPRANHRYVTLHDAVAEELAQRVIGLHDPDERQRRELWRRAAGIYADQAGDLEGQLAEKQAALDARLLTLDTAKKEQDSALVTAADEAALIGDVAELDGWAQELNQLRVSRLFYQLLSDYATGAQQFIVLLRQAREQRDVLFEDMLTFQMQRFLPGGIDQNTTSDIVGAAISSFRDWLRDEGQDSYVDIGLELAAYLIDREHLQAALGLLDQLPMPADHWRLYRLRNLQGNACLRIPGRVREAGERFQDAMAETSQIPLPDQSRYRADAYKELGFYYRNIGQWKHAEEAYRKARDSISQVPPPDRPDSAREEVASIQTNWAYVMGIGGRYDDAINLVESAITVRRRIGRRHEQAISCSVKGEIYRYQRQFNHAWAAYAEAEQLFREQNSWSWLGVIYQEQAICLFQAIPAGVQLLPAQQDPVEQAESLILRSLEMCKVLNARAYPSALNRAGRIFGEKDPELGLRFLRESAERARGLSDGWFWVASLVEYAELCYRAWSQTGNAGYLEQIRPIASELKETAEANIEFAELRGRWSVLQGHLGVHEALATGSQAALEAALDNYRLGFPLIASGWVGSYGASAIHGQFRKFIDLVWLLPLQTRERWLRELYRSWSGLEESSATQLLARLEELY